MILSFRDDFAVDDLESPVKLLMGAFPSVVAPQVVARVAVDAFLQHFEEAPCDGILLQFVGGARDEFHGHDIQSSSWPFHIHIKHRIVHFPHDFLAVGKHWRVMVEERQPQVYVVPFGGLVRDISEVRHLFFTPVGEQVSEDVFFRHAHTAQMLAQVEEEPVEDAADSVEEATEELVEAFKDAVAEKADEE